jgi:hypothetical protein
MRLPVVFSLGLLGSVLCLSCARSGGSPVADATRSDDGPVADVEGVTARLQGAWRVTSYVPDVPLEPTLSALVTSQLQTVVVRFEGPRFRADSELVHMNRAYEVRGVGVDRFKLAILDESSVPFEGTVHFEGPNAGSMRSETAPWRGTMRMSRVDP